LAAENKYKYSKAYFKILNLIKSNPKENVFVIRGGQGAGKTISILELIIQSLLSSEKEATVLSSELSKMKRTVIRDYRKICKDWGLITNENDFNKSESKHEYPNDSYIDFLGADVTDVGKGFRRDILYINEADKMDIETAIQFISRAKLTIIDYNPDSLFWGDDFINENNFITLTFEDNEYLSEQEVQSIYEYKNKGFYNPNLPDNELFKEENIKSKYWANKWRVYGLGLVGSLQGVVFDNWEEIDEIPTNAELVCYAMDFGFTNDPTALISIYRADMNLYINELIYSTGLTNPKISQKINELNLDEYEEIVCDSAEPKSIQELIDLGVNAKPAKKGADSIKASIDILHRFKIHITKRSKNVLREIKGFTWAVDKQGNSLNEPIGTNDHAMAALRYGALNHLGERTRMEFY
jgi:phage terminase large subunit